MKKNHSLFYLPFRLYHGLVFAGAALTLCAFASTTLTAATSAATASANTNLVPAAPASAGSITSAKSRVPKGPPSLQSSGWQKLFDGKSLAGWKITDFAGRGDVRVEDGQINPLGVYGATKLEAERCVLANPKHTVVRTSLNGGKSPSGNRSFTEEIHRAWAAGRTLRFYTDEFRCPIAAPVTARAIWLLAAKGQPGLYHLAGSQRLSRWEIGQMLAACWLELSPQLESATLREAAGPPRAPDTSLDCAKLERLLGLRLPGFGEWLAGYADEAF